MESYSRGPEAEILNKTIGEVFLDTARRFESREALIVRHQKIRWTWGEFATEAKRVAAGLIALGLKPQDRVGVWATNCAEWTALQFGTALAGVVLVNINPAYRTSELSFVLKKSRIKALFLHAKDARSDYRAILDESLHGQDVPLKDIIYLGTSDWDAFLRPPDVDLPKIDPASPVNIQYTSGTTGSPKGVLLTHINLINNGRFTAECLAFTEKDKICVPLPLFHCFAEVLGMLAAANSGVAVILPSATFDALATLQAIDEEQATALYGVPTMFIAELQHPDFAKFNTRSLRTGIMSGSPCPIEVMKRVESEMHCPQILIGYGQTEASPLITVSKSDATLEQRCTTVGCAMQVTEVKIVDPVSGETLPVGEQGELLTRGYLVMKGYDDEPEATARAIDNDGWLHTGDLATMRPDGYFRITGRAKDMIIRGGENIYPREIEEFLYTHPKIREAQILGLPDDRLGEIVVAWVRLKDGETATEEEIREFCKGKLAHFKIPAHIRIVDAFPLTQSGKVQKYRIREFEIRERGLEAAARRETA